MYTAHVLGLCPMKLITYKNSQRALAQLAPPPLVSVSGVWCPGSKPTGCMCKLPIKRKRKLIKNDDARKIIRVYWLLKF